MNPAWLGDSYDVVKRFFCDAARTHGYTIYVDPMYSGKWTPSQRNSFLRFLGARPLESTTVAPPAALLMDPDTGIRVRPGASHVTFETVAARCDEFRLVLVFDQAFSRGPRVRDDLVKKLAAFQALGVRGVYFDSHARLLICGRKPAPVMRFQKSLIRLGLPATRFVGIAPPAATGRATAVHSVRRQSGRS